MATTTKKQLSNSIPKRKKTELRDKPVEISPNQLAFEFYDAPFSIVSQQLSNWKYKTESHLMESFK
jgi:hypothetical protein